MSNLSKRVHRARYASGNRIEGFGSAGSDSRPGSYGYAGSSGGYGNGAGGYGNSSGGFGNSPGGYGYDGYGGGDGSYGAGRGSVSRMGSVGTAVGAAVGKAMGTLRGRASSSVAVGLVSDPPPGYGGGSGGGPGGGPGGVGRGSGMVGMGNYDPSKVSASMVRGCGRLHRRFTRGVSLGCECVSGVDQGFEVTKRNVKPTHLPLCFFYLLFSWGEGGGGMKAVMLYPHDLISSWGAASCAL